jgi:hypothetical protein
LLRNYILCSTAKYIQNGTESQGDYQAEKMGAEKMENYEFIVHFVGFLTAPLFLFILNVEN